MQVYIEYAFLDNFIMDFLLIRISLKCAKIKTSVLRLIVASIIGTVLTITLSLFTFKSGILIVLKILLGLLIAFLGGSYIKVKDYFLGAFYFFLFTFLSGGIIIAVFNLAGIDYESYFILNYDSVIPIGVTFLIVYLSSKGFTLLIENIIKNKENENFFRKCEIVVKGKKLKAVGFIDTGNKLYDNFTGLPVIIASQSFIKRLALNNSLPSTYKNLKIETVNGSSTIKIFYIDKLMIYKGTQMNIYNNVLLGEGYLNLDVGEKCDLLLHSTLY